MLLRFGAFELDARGRQLRKSGAVVKLPPQPFQLLQMLAENTGELQTREDIQRRIWGNGTFVDFDRSLNVCMAQIRAALNDDAEAPRFIETLPRRGYRFVAPVEKVAPRVRRQRYVRVALAAAVVATVVAAGFWIWRRPAPQPRRVLVAALVFDNLGGGQDLFVDGLSEELTSQLGSLHPARLGVIARASVMHYKGKAPSIRQMARDLQVDYVIEGTVRQTNGRMRITARLIQGGDQAQVWTDTYESPSDDWLEAQQEAAARITSSVARHLFGGETAGSGRRREPNRAAYEAYRNGRYLLHKGSREGLERGLAQLEEAARLDPAFAEAHAAVAEASVSLARAGGPSQQLYGRARAAATRAIELHAASDEGHNALANVLFWKDWNWAEAERHFRRAVEINPSFAAAHHDYAWLLLATGRTEPGLDALRRAIAFDPLSARINIDAGWLLLQAHRFDQAARQARRALELEPGMAEATACLSRSLLCQGRYAEALELALQGKPELKTEVAGLEARAAIEKLYRARLPSDPYRLAMQYAFLGEKGQALEALDRAYQAGAGMMPFLRTEPAFVPLRGEPRFQELARKVGLP